jgi:uncharacterized protein
MFVGICRISLDLSGNSSLKGKRKILRRIIDRTRAKFNCAVAEVADNDSHRNAVIGIAVVGNTSSHVDSMLGNISRFVESTGVAPVASIGTEVIPMGSRPLEDCQW